MEDRARADNPRQDDEEMALNGPPTDRSPGALVKRPVSERTPGAVLQPWAKAT
jgi:hypothetical protein